MLEQAFYSLRISSEPSIETFNAITKILNIEEPLYNKLEEISSSWELTKTVNKTKSFRFY